MSQSSLFDSSIAVDKNDPLPRHIQVQRILRDLIEGGKLRPGDKIPAELDIASTLGVSKMTVNKALLALTAEGLFIREVGRGTFVADPNSEKTVREKPRIVLSFVEGARNILESDYYANLYRGVMDALQPEQAGKELDVVLAPLAAEDYIDEERRVPADGRLIIAPRIESLPSIEALWELGRSVVVIGASWSAMGVPSVDSDNIGGAVEAVQHLLGLGHRRIALLYAEEETANTQDRIAGYRRAMAMAKLPYDPACEVRAERAWDAGEAARKQLVALMLTENPVTAIFAGGYYLALEAMNAARDAGLQIPGDISVVGYDDPRSAGLIFPPLATVRQPLYEMGRHAAERLLRLVYGTENRTLIREVLPAQLVIRASTAPVGGVK